MNDKFIRPIQIIAVIAGVSLIVTTLLELANGNDEANTALIAIGAGGIASAFLLSAKKKQKPTDNED